MDRLDAALQRLYGMSSSEQGARCSLLIVFRRASDWPTVAEMLRVMQEDLALPLPAVSVSGESGYVVWLALDKAVSRPLGRSFLEALRRTVLADIRDGDLDFLAMPAQLFPIPACCEATGRWSAFIDPTMGSLFMDEAGLDFAPSADRQADLLGALSCIEQEALQAASVRLMPTPEPCAQVRSAEISADDGSSAEASAFLRGIMNDPEVPLALRIEAAKGLLLAGKAR